MHQYDPSEHQQMVYHVRVHGGADERDRSAAARATRCDASARSRSRM
jgi:hypothetical protein